MDSCPSLRLLIFYFIFKNPLRTFKKFHVEHFILFQVSSFTWNEKQTKTKFQIPQNVKPET